VFLWDPLGTIMRSVPVSLIRAVPDGVGNVTSQPWNSPSCSSLAMLVRGNPVGAACIGQWDGPGSAHPQIIILSTIRNLCWTTSISTLFFVIFPNMCKIHFTVLKILNNSWFLPERKYSILVFMGLTCFT
jgi:hypothetical protein